MAEFTFKDIQILQNEALGSGAYGVVCRAKCDQLVCAAKFLHSVFFETNDPGVNDCIERFQRECNMLSQISHPNVVQYLGTHRQPGIQTVVLLMEMLDESLDHYLSRHTAQPLPFHLEVQFSHDIAQALDYLHHNGIHHRDLSSKNVLLLGEFRAKVSDFGMSKLRDPRAGYSSCTTCPGNILYMPPEALNTPAELSETLDEFSLGVVMIQIMNRKDPNPGRLQESMGGDLVYRVIPERERRDGDIQLCDSTNPLLPLALLCIEHTPKDRPLASFLCRYLSLLNYTVRYKESREQESNKTRTPSANDHELDDFVVVSVDEQGQDFIDKIQSLTRQLEERDRLVLLQSQILATRERNLWEKDQIIKEKEDQISRIQKAESDSRSDLLLQHEMVVSQLQADLQYKKDVQVSCDAQISQYMSENELLKQQIEELEQQHRPPSMHRPPSKHRDDHFVNSLQWVEGRKMPTSLQPQSSSVASCNGKIFVSHCNFHRGKGHVYQYSLQGGGLWEELPVVTKSEFSLAVVDDTVLAVGGSFQLRSCGSILGLTKTASGNGSWIKKFPDMPTPRSFPSCASTAKYLFVVGGEKGGEPVSQVELLNVERNSWMYLASIPLSLCRHYTRMTTCINEDTLYCLGGLYQQAVLSQNGFVAKIDELINHRDLKRPAWRELPPSPSAGAGYTVYRNRVLALGGFATDLKCYSSDIHALDRRGNWERIDSLPLPLSRCNAAVSKDASGRDVMVVVGGNNSNGVNANTFIADLINLPLKY